MGIFLVVMAAWVALALWISFAAWVCNKVSDRYTDEVGAFVFVSMMAPLIGAAVALASN